MWKKAKPAPPPVTPSLPEGSETESAPTPPQLSDPNRVNSDVSSVALNYGLPAMGIPSTAAPASTNGEETTDAEVMLRVKAGDDEAFDFLEQKYRRPIINFMYRMAHNTAAAEDLAQEVFLRVYRSRGSYEPSAKFTTWLYRIATNLAVNHARDTRHERPETMVSLDEPDEETGTSMDVADSSLTVEEKLVRRERLMAIRKTVQKLPERQRIAVLMHKYQQMDYKQIAEVLKLS